MNATFATLENDLRIDQNHPRRSLTVVQDVALNIFGALIREGLYGLGIMLLDFCAELLWYKSNLRNVSAFFYFLSRVLRDSGPDRSRLDFHMQTLVEQYTRGIESLNCPPGRQELQAQRRKHGFLRDSRAVGMTLAARDVVDNHKKLFIHAKRKLGPTHEDTLRIENDFLRMQHHTGVFQHDYLQRVQAAMRELDRANTQEEQILPRAQWDPTHRAAYQRYLERKCDYYKYHGQQDDAIAIATGILEVEGYRTERWIQFFLDFELWLGAQGMFHVLQDFQNRRLESGYYQDLRAKHGEVDITHGGGQLGDPIYSVIVDRWA